MMKTQRIDAPNTVGVPIETQARSSAAPYALAPDERAVVREAVDRATQGELASEADVNAILRRPWG